MLQQIYFKIISHLIEPVPLVEGEWLNVTFNVPILVDIHAPLTPTLITIYVIEFILIVFGMFLMVYFNHFINSNGIIHLNLQYLFVFSTILYLLASFARFYLIMVQLKIVQVLDTPYLLLAGLIRLEHYGLSLSAVLVVTVERAFATYFVIDYESKRRRWVALFCVFVGLTYTQFFVIPVCFFKAPLYYIILYSSLWAIFASVFLFGLQRYNVQESIRLSWKAKNISRNVNYTLGKKFQVEENVKVIRILLAMSFMLVFLTIFVIIFIVVPRVYIGTGTYAGQLMISLFDLNLALGAILIPGISIIQLRKTRELPFTQKIYCLNNKKQDEHRVNPITVFEDVTKTYFDQFHTSWR